MRHRFAILEGNLKVRAALNPMGGAQIVLMKILVELSGHSYSTHYIEHNFVRYHYSIYMYYPKDHDIKFEDPETGQKRLTAALVEPISLSCIDPTFDPIERTRGSVLRARKKKSKSVQNFQTVE